MIGKKSVGVGIGVIFIAYLYNSYRTVKILSPVIETETGKVQGFEAHSRAGREYLEFLGIPYAKPPVGELRFEPPQPAEKWDGIRDASFFGAICMQIEAFSARLGGKEDCLFLNVFVPKNREKSLPVMVYFHGGAFIMGSSNEYGAKYFMDEDVILVTLNYRVAALGFLNTGDDVVRGNMGLKDQTRALQWVQDNIKNFGGDPKQVTIFGESAGGASVQFHIVSPLSKGLFSKAISQSGSSLNNWAIYRNPGEQARRFAAKFDIPTDNSKEMISQLKKVDGETFVNAHIEVMVPLRDPICVFVPTIEAVKDKNTFLPDDPLEILKSGKFNKVPLISGVNSEEGLLTSSIVTANQTKLNQANDDWNDWAPRILNYPRNDEVSQKIRKFYFGDASYIATEDMKENYTNMFSDNMFFYANHLTARLHSQHAPIYLYFYNHHGEFSLSMVLRATQGRLPVIVTVIYELISRWVRTTIFRQHVPPFGVCHADEIPFFFNWPLTSQMNPESKEYDLSVTLVKTWTSFVADKKPLKIQSTTWEQINPKEATLRYMKIDDVSMMIDEPFTQRIEFWKSLHLR